MAFHSWKLKHNTERNPAVDLKKEDLPKPTYFSDRVIYESKELENEAEELEHEAKDVDLKAEELDHKTKKLDHKAKELDHEAKELDRCTKKLEHCAQDLGHRTQDLGHHAQELGHYSQELDIDTQELDVDPKELDVYTKEMGPKTLLLDPETEWLVLEAEKVDRETEEVDHKAEEVDHKNQELEHAAEELDPKPEDLGPESEDLRECLGRKGGLPSDQAVMVPCTLAISLAFPVDTGTKKHLPEVESSKLRRVFQPKQPRFYHIEYFLLPEDEEPTRVDLMLFTKMARLFFESEVQVRDKTMNPEQRKSSRPSLIVATVKPWYENDQIWVSWNHTFKMNVTNAFLKKLLYHKIILKIWDSKDKVNPKVTCNRPRISEQLDELDCTGVECLVSKQRELFEQQEPKPSVVKKKDSNVFCQPGKFSRHHSAENKAVSKEAKEYANESTHPSSAKTVTSLTMKADDLAVIRRNVSKSSVAKKKSLIFIDIKKGSGFSRSKRQKSVTKINKQKGILRSSLKSKKIQHRNWLLYETLNEQIMKSLLPKTQTILFMQLVLMPLFAGKRYVVCRLPEKCAKITDCFLSFTTETPLMTEKQKQDLNPLVIEIKSVKCLPLSHVPVTKLQEMYVPVYCKYQFHNAPPHQTRGQAHGTHVYFQDVSVVLAGTIDPLELQEYLEGPPMEVEIHDRDRKREVYTKRPSLFGEELDDDKLRDVNLVAFNQQRRNTWDPYGIAKVSLADLLLGQTFVNIFVAIQRCQLPDPGRYPKKHRDRRISGAQAFAVGPWASPVPPDCYLESNSLLKLRVEVAVPLRAGAELEDGKMAGRQFGRIIYTFDSGKTTILHDLLQSIIEINAKEFGLDIYSVQDMQEELASIKMPFRMKRNPNLNVITGFHLLDGKIHLLVLEGLRDQGIKKLWERQLDQTLKTDGGKLKILYNSQLSFQRRLYPDLDALLFRIHLCKPLASLMKESKFHIRRMVPRACFQALTRLYCIYQSTKFKDVIQGDLLPSSTMIKRLSREFTIPIEGENLAIHKPLLPSNVSLALEKEKTPTKSHLPCSEPEDHQKKYEKWSRNMVRNKQNYVQKNIEAVPQNQKALPRTEIIRLFPTDGKSVYNYSTQNLNSSELAKQHLCRKMAMEPGKRFTYSQHYLSASIEPVKWEAEWKKSRAKTKHTWLISKSFQLLGFQKKSESKLLPSIPPTSPVKVSTERRLEANLNVNILKSGPDQEKHLNINLDKPYLLTPLGSSSFHSKGVELRDEHHKGPVKHQNINLKSSQIKCLRGHQEKLVRFEDEPKNSNLKKCFFLKANQPLSDEYEPLDRSGGKETEEIRRSCASGSSLSKLTNQGSKCNESTVSQQNTEQKTHEGHTGDSKKHFL
ncbi:uncharacterized protein KIAA1257 homolog isoform X3 [Tachyglossus aculeatus]|uniref:uncharacterized protein KIAA1257 homolog isoform X3 n=1 Tax=Tachyglossus aculeatus TaxID=9261 RepID=UPI0018F66AE3|nr:uncharacterized protein KIAA1257 homolog isoform X3 [Tachyglossus aculeatus]